MRRFAAVLLSLALCVGSRAEEPLGLLELFNYYEYSPSLASSGQPTRDQLPAIAAAGIEAVINLVPVDSPDAYAEEGELVRALGLDYRHIPIAWEQPTGADLEAFLAAMQAFRDKRVLVHCYANARASAFVYLWRVRHGGDAAGLGVEGVMLGHGAILLLVASREGRPWLGERFPASSRKAAILAHRSGCCILSATRDA